ncbi:GerMN domain-containing protein [Arthrobacter sp. ISL-48]|uniref:GerMN domain-containing protein n=1 Tax=Arthrobacter sp. ISL-48 TaxID=2819110 RepID=UPI001BE945CE|nr:GerMN domain-containing protein [Arthrobacter sp. ISL-48]MBT2533636.1 GerMN domain-containing protein [Arthrobacter sp. ISL-48]
MTAAAAVALVFPLWLGACTVGPGSPTGTVAGGQAATPEDAAAPAPQPAPPAGSSTDNAPDPGPLPATTPSASPESPATPDQGTGGAGGAGQAEAAVPGTAPVSGANATSAPPPPPATPAPGNVGGTKTVTAYYVLLDDGGSGGVRFGCNDSLVGVHLPAAGSTEPLRAAMGALLDGAEPPAGDAYNSLQASTLKFLSGSFDGTTVTVYLSGTIRPGGVCDVPRVEAQLTQTAVASVEAIRADIYVNGVALTEALSLR